MNDKTAKKFEKSKITLYEIMADHATQWEDLDGNYARATCPFCPPDGSKHLLLVNRKKDIFYCSSCNTGGDRITYIATLKNISFNDAVHYLADTYVDTHLY